MCACWNLDLDGWPLSGIGLAGCALAPPIMDNGEYMWCGLIGLRSGGTVTQWRRLPVLHQARIWCLLHTCDMVRCEGRSVTDCFRYDSRSRTLPRLPFSIRPGGPRALEPTFRGSSAASGWAPWLAPRRRALAVASRNAEVCELARPAPARSSRSPPVAVPHSRAEMSNWSTGACQKPIPNVKLNRTEHASPFSARRPATNPFPPARLTGCSQLFRNLNSHAARHRMTPHELMTGADWALQLRTPALLAPARSRLLAPVGRRVHSMRCPCAPDE